MRQPSKYIELILILFAIGCKQPTNDSLARVSSDSLISETNNTKPTTTDSINKPTEQKRVNTLIVKDSTKYSKRFLDGLRGSVFGTKFELIDNLIITDDRYRNDFGQILPDNQTVILTAQRNGNKYSIKVRQVKLTTISYDFELTDSKGQKIVETGLADMPSAFMLGSETDSDENDKTYAVTEYLTLKEKCLFAIRLGVLDKKIVCRLSGCNDNMDYFKVVTLR